VNHVYSITSVVLHLLRFSRFLAMVSHSTVIAVILSKLVPRLDGKCGWMCIRHLANVQFTYLPGRSSWRWDRSVSRLISCRQDERCSISGKGTNSSDRHYVKIGFWGHTHIPMNLL
jgi:hypothetical protein